MSPPPHMSIRDVLVLPGNRLRWIRALVLPVMPGAFRFWLGFRMIAAFTLCVCICVDAGVWDSTPLAHRQYDGKKLPWLIYGTNLALLAAFFYFALSVWLAFTTPYTFYNEQEHDGMHMPKLAYIVWGLHTLAMPAMVYTLIIYVTFLRDYTTYRQSQFAAYIILCIFMSLNFLLSNVPLLIQNVPWTTIAVTCYLCLIGIIQAVANGYVYPAMTTVGDGLFIIAICTVVHVALVAVQMGRNKVCCSTCAPAILVWFESSPSGTTIGLGGGV